MNLMKIMVWVNVGWISFLILCVCLPALSRYYRRRRDARVLDENFANVQSRLAEIERKRIQGSNDSKSREDISQQDWERLEHIFGPLPSHSPEDKNNRLNTSVSSRLWVKMLDTLSSLGYALPIGRTFGEYERKREQGRRLVAALKETSAVVQEFHFISKDLIKRDNDGTNIEGVNDGMDLYDKMGCSSTTSHKCDHSNARDGSSETEIDLDIESGCANQLNSTNTNELTRSVHEIDLKASIQEKLKTSSDHSYSQSQTEVSTSTINDSTPMNNHSTTMDDIPTKSQDSSGEAACHSIDVQVPKVPPPEKSAPSHESLCQVIDDPSQDDHDSKYIGLCLPCSNLFDDNTTLPHGIVPQSRAASKTLLVSVKCPICIDQYQPGCYVSWSHNKECTHAFHRDCILMWLLKKEEPLCPCCRREFVSESTSNESINVGHTSGGVELDVANSVPAVGV